MIIVAIATVGAFIWSLFFTLIIAKAFWNVKKEQEYEEEKTRHS